MCFVVNLDLPEMTESTKTQDNALFSSVSDDVKASLTLEERGGKAYLNTADKEEAFFDADTFLFWQPLQMKNESPRCKQHKKHSCKRDRNNDGDRQLTRRRGARAKTKE